MWAHFFRRRVYDYVVSDRFDSCEFAAFFGEAGDDGPQNMKGRGDRRAAAAQSTRFIRAERVRLRSLLRSAAKQGGSAGNGGLLFTETLLSSFSATGQADRRDGGLDEALEGDAAYVPIVLE